MNLFFTGRVPTIWEWHVMVPPETLAHPTNRFGTWWGGAKSPSRSLKDEFLFCALCVLFLCFGLSPTAPSSQWEFSILFLETQLKWHLIKPL